MLIRFHNLGKIKATTLDLRPLTVIIGPNNSNKTYIAYSLYGLWQAQQPHPVPFDDIDYELLSDDSVLVAYNDNFTRAIQGYISEALYDFQDDLSSFYQDSSGKLFSDTFFEVDTSQGDIADALQYLSGKTAQLFGSDFKFFFDGQVSIISSPPKVGDQKRNIDSGSPTKPNPRFLVTVLVLCLLRGLFPEPFLLPAERNAFIITYKMLANRRYKALREGIRQALGSRESAQRQLDLLREGGEVRYPQPVEDFLDFLTDVESAKPPNTRSPFAKLADTIESSIQNTNKTRYRPTALGGKEIIIQIEKGLDIDLYNASSSIKQLAPLLLYLRYRAKENDLLIIDEPEMNLHPESQAKLLEVLAMLVNHGVNVLLTTHSPYLMAHLNNLAQADGTSQAVRNRQAKSLYLKHPDSLLRMDQVSAYEMKDNQLQSLKDPDYGIRWDTLSDVSADLQQRYFAIYEEGHAKERTGNGRKAAIPKDGQSASRQAGPDQP